MPRKTTQKYIWIPKTRSTLILGETFVLDEIPDELWSIIFFQLSISDLLHIILTSKLFNRKVQKFNWKDYLEYHQIICSLNSQNNFISQYGKFLAKAKINSKQWFVLYKRVTMLCNSTKLNHYSLCFNLSYSEDILIMFENTFTRVIHENTYSHRVIADYITHDPRDILLKKLLSTYEVIYVY